MRRFILHYRRPQHTAIHVTWFHFYIVYFKVTQDLLSRANLHAISYLYLVEMKRRKVIYFSKNIANDLMEASRFIFGALQKESKNSSWRHRENSIFLKNQQDTRLIKLHFVNKIPHKSLFNDMTAIREHEIFKLCSGIQLRVLCAHFGGSEVQNAL